MTSLLAVMLVLEGAGRARAAEEEEEEPERIEGLTVDTITVECSPSEDEVALLALSGLATGRAYRAEDVRRGVVEGDHMSAIAGESVESLRFFLAGV